MDILHSAFFRSVSEFLLHFFLKMGLVVNYRYEKYKKDSDKLYQLIYYF